MIGDYFALGTSFDKVRDRLAYVEFDVKYYNASVLRRLIKEDMPRLIEAADLMKELIDVNTFKIDGHLTMKRVSEIIRELNQ